VVAAAAAAEVVIFNPDDAVVNTEGVTALLLRSLVVVVLLLLDWDSGFVGCSCKSICRFMVMMVIATHTMNATMGAAVPKRKVEAIPENDDPTVSPLPTPHESAVDDVDALDVVDDKVVVVLLVLWLLK
jgi:hypothetical protein